MKLQKRFLNKYLVLLELISAYVVQNPFLWGQYMLRRQGIKNLSKQINEKKEKN